MSECGPDCNCGAHDPKPEAPATKLGCIIILRDGSAHQIEGLSITNAKHFRRTKGVTAYRKADGTQQMIDGKKTLRVIIEQSHMSSFDACKVLFQLLEARLVRRRAT